MRNRTVRLDVPPPVARYLHFALTPGMRPVRTARFRQAGFMRASGDAPWRRFTAVERFSTQPVEFAWDAWMAIIPFVPVRIHDSYVHGRGASGAKLAGLVAVAERHGTPEMASASLLRYLAELPWLPTALLPSEKIVWSAIDDTSARVTLHDSGTTVSLEVGFGDDGAIARVSALRHRDVRGNLVLTPWAGRFGEYTRVGEMMIPHSAEVQWVTAQGPEPVWRGRIVEARYTFATVFGEA